MPASRRIDEKDAQLRRAVIRGHAEDAADALALELRDPSCFPGWIMPAGVVSHDARDQCLKRGIPTELPRVELAVRADDPAEVTRLIELADSHPLVHHDRLSVIIAPIAAAVTETVVSVPHNNPMTDTQRPASARRGELLDAAYRYALAHG